MTEPQPDSPAKGDPNGQLDQAEAGPSANTPAVAKAMGDKTGDEPRLARAAGDNSSAPEAYDFRVGNELSRDSVSQLRIHCQRLCKVLGPVASAYLGTPTDTQLETLEAASFEHCFQNPGGSLAIGLIEVAAHLSKIAWRVDGGLVGAIVGRMLGGPALKLDRSPTALEAALLGRFIQEVVDVWAATWEGLAQWQPSLREVVTDLAQLQAVVQDEQVAWLGIRTRIGDEEGDMDVYLPVGTMQRLLGAEEGRPQSTAHSAALVLSDTAAQVRVPVSLVVHQSATSLRQAMRLRPGDVIPLRKPLDAPLTVAVEGRAKFLAQAGVRQGHLAARLLAPSDDFAP